MWSKVKSIARRVLGGISILTFVVLVVVTLLGVFSRHILKDQYRWSEELARVLLVWISFLGGTLAYIDDKHLGVETLVACLDSAAARIATLFGHVLILVFAFFVMGIGGADLVLGRFDSGQILPALQISRGWFYLVIPVSGFLITFFAIGNLISFFSRTTTPDPKP